MTACRLLILLILAISLFSSGCTRHRLRVATDAAFRQHLAPVSHERLNPIDYVVAPPSVAWEAARSALEHNGFAVALADPSQNKLDTWWDYSPVRREAGTNSIARTKLAVLFSRNQRFGLAADATATSERREVDVCSSESEWSSFTSSTKGSRFFTDAINKIINNKVLNARVSRGMLVFPLEPSELADGISGVAAPYTGKVSPSPSGAAFQSVWRTTETMYKNVKVQTRSMFSAKATKVDGGSKLMISAVIQYRGFDEEEIEFDWRGADSSNLVDGLWGRTLRVATPSPYVLSKVPVRVDVASETSEPELPPPADPLAEIEPRYTSAFATTSRPSNPVAAEHVSFLGEFQPSKYLAVPYSLAWNTAYRVLQGKGGSIGVADSNRRFLETNWSYQGVVSEQWQNKQARAKIRLKLSKGGELGYRYKTTVSMEGRFRKVCQDASAWRPATGGNSSLPAVEEQLVSQIEQSLRDRLSSSSVVPDQVVFKTNASNLARAISQRSRPYTGSVSAEGNEYVVESGCRITERASGGGREQVRSRYRIRVTPEGRGARIVVAAHMESRRISADNEASAWEAIDAGAIQNGLYAIAEKVARPNPIMVGEEALEESTDYAENEPELPAPADPLMGQYELYIRLVSPPSHKPDGSNWDPHGLISSFIKIAPIVLETGVRLYMQDYRGVAKSLMRRAVGHRSKVQQVLDNIAGSIAAPVAGKLPPDLCMVMSWNGQKSQTNVVPDATLARFDRRPFLIDLHGSDTQINWTLWDVDRGSEHDRISSGTVSARDLADACGVTCMAREGTQVCFELERP